MKYRIKKYYRSYENIQGVLVMIENTAILDNIIKDLSNRLNIKIEKDNMRFFTEGATDSIVFSIDNKYLIKTVDNNTLKTQIEFFEFYKTIPNLQRIILYNENLGYICFKYIDGEKFNKTNIDEKDIINQIYGIVSKYHEYDCNAYGYLREDNYKNWSEFLESEVNHSSEAINSLNISTDKVKKAISNISLTKTPRYLLHGDFGTHNFLIENGKIMVIDSMPVVGDYLYDFYFAILSNVNIFSKVTINYILNFFERDMEYKKDLFVVILYIRMCRCYIYNRQDFDIYVNLYNAIS